MQRNRYFRDKISEEVDVREKGNATDIKGENEIDIVAVVSLNIIAITA